MKEIQKYALDILASNRVDYADVRVVETETESIEISKRRIDNIGNATSAGLGIRVMNKGAWGFASTNILTKQSIEITVRRAIEIANCSALARKSQVKLAPTKFYNDKWATPFKIDPFTVSLNEKISLLSKIDEILLNSNKIVNTQVAMTSVKENIYFASYENGNFASDIEQNLMYVSANYAVFASNGSDIQRRSFPGNHGSALGGGYEHIQNAKLLENAENIREESIALLTADTCPSGEKDIILDGDQLALQIHESVGHPLELDRVLGMEASYAGRSFVTTDKYHDKFKYASDDVTLFVDPSIEFGLATRPYDDEGVRSKAFNVVENGKLNGYYTSRELAHKIGDEESRGCNRADGFENIPIIRIPNLGLRPGIWDFEELIKDTKDGIYMKTNKSWSIDQMRLNFQFGTEIGWEIKNGKITRMLKNPSYQGITPKFWNNCNGIANEKSFHQWGVTNCGKGQPGQTARMTHANSPARFRKVNVGVKS